MASPRHLPIVLVGKKFYYVDVRLRQVRNIDDPHDIISFSVLGEGEW